VRYFSGVVRYFSGVARYFSGALGDFSRAVPAQKTAGRRSVGHNSKIESKKRELLHKQSQAERLDSSVAQLTSIHHHHRRANRIIRK